MFFYYENGRNKWAVRDEANRLIARFDSRQEAKTFVVVKTLQS